MPSCVVPPLPGVTPPTTFVPYSTICFVWNVPSLPVIPCTTRRVDLSTRTLIWIGGRWSVIRVEKRARSIAIELATHKDRDGKINSDQLKLLAVFWHFNL